MEMRFDKAIYEKQVLLKTAYSFIDRVYIHLSQSETEWIVSWKLKGNCRIAPDEFENELIQQQLRFELIKENNDIRKILLGRAMASTLIEKPSEAKPTSTGSYSANDILRGWFDEPQRPSV